MGLTQAFMFCQLTAIMRNLFVESLFNTTAQSQKYKVFDSMEPILDICIFVYLYIWHWYIC